MSRALLRRYPAILGRMPVIDLLSGPTPVESFAGLGREFGHEALYVKRDDASAPEYGGNKPRKLEFLLADARRSGATSVVTMGGIGTNHGLATAIFARKLGMACRLVLFDQPVTENVRRNLRLFHRFGAECHYAGSYPKTAWLVAKELAQSRMGDQGPTYLVPAGGTNARGCLGFVSAALELEDQVRAGICPEPALIFCAVGSCGTYAGLLAGLALTGLRTRAIGVRVVDRLVVNRPAVLKFARRALALLKDAGATMGEADVRSQDVHLLHEFFGGEYGRVTEDGRRAVEMAAVHGLKTETTYTGKALAGMRDYLTKNPTEAPVLFWNTYSSVDLSEEARSVSPENLPPELRRFLAESP